MYCPQKLGNENNLNVAIQSLHKMSVLLNICCVSNQSIKLISQLISQPTINKSINHQLTFQVGYVAGAMFLILLSYDCCLSRRSGTTVRWKVLLMATLGTWVVAGLLTVPVYWLEKAYWRATGECRIGPLFHMVVAPLSLPILILFVVLPILLSWTFLVLGLRSRKVTLKKGQSAGKYADGGERGLVKLEKVKKLEEVKKGQDYDKKGKVKGSDARRLKDVHKKGAAKRSGDIKGLKKVEKGVDRRSLEVKESSSHVVEKRSGAARGSSEIKQPLQGVVRIAPKGTIELMEWEEDEVGMDRRTTQVRTSQEVAKESAGEVREMEKRVERRLTEIKDFRHFEKEPYKRSAEVKETKHTTEKEDLKSLSEVKESKSGDKEPPKMSSDVKEPKAIDQQGTTTTTTTPKKSAEPKDQKKGKPGQGKKETTPPAGSFEVTRSFVAALILTFTMCQAPHWTYRYFYNEHDQGYNFYINTFFLLLLQFNQVINPFLWLGHSRRAPYTD